MQTSSILKHSAQYVKGVGEKRFQLLSRLGVGTVEDLLYFFPKRYEDRSQILPISKLKRGEFQVVKGEVLTAGLQRTRKGPQIFRLFLGDDTGVISAVWFNQPYMKNYFSRGDRVVLYGKVEMFNGLQISSPEYEVISSDERLHTGRIVPIYPLTQRLNQKALRIIIRNTLDKYIEQVPEYLWDDISRRLNMVDIFDAVKEIHFPRDWKSLESARQRLIFDEFFFLQTALLLKKGRRKNQLKGIEHSSGEAFKASFARMLSFELTAAQKRVIGEIEEDMKSPRPMNRLLQGDVGSGKTVVAAFALALTVRNGFQGVMMAPTEILAEQHYLWLAGFLGGLGINVGLLIGGLSEDMKRKVCEDISSGDLELVIGTHTLIQERVLFKKLGLVVIDEQHKFGVMQRSALGIKGFNPDILVMTATPIPRTLAMTVYGDMELSTIDELPRGRKAIRTFSVEEHRRCRVYRFVREEVKKGRQVYVIYPLIESSKALDLKAVTEGFEHLSKDIFPELKVELLHGKIKREKKEKIMRGFKDGKIDILLSTIVVEVGIDVSNASVMIIENAERFGLSQLHQLRGRIGRGRHNSYCVLFGNPKTEESKQRVEAMLKTTDGFRIAEEDLAIRGPGEFFGVRQHGLPELRIGNIISDMKLMSTARREAESLLKQDPLLQNPLNKIIKERLKERFGDGNYFI